MCCATSPSLRLSSLVHRRTIPSTRSLPKLPEYAKFAQTLSATKTRVATIQAGDLIRFGDAEIEVLWPPAAAHANEPSRNNDSIVLRVEFGRRSLLLTGDIEKSGERALIAGGKQLRADVVKVPHHGSRRSSTLPFVA